MPAGADAAQKRLRRLDNGAIPEWAALIGLLPGAGFGRPVRSLVASRFGFESFLKVGNMIRWSE
jgi:hypothetical protein